MNINYERIGSRLREARKAKHMTQRTVADYLNMETNSYSNLERGAQPISLKRIIDLCVLYGVQPGYLLNDCCPELLQIDSPLPENSTDEHKALFKVLEQSSDQLKHTLLLVALALQDDESVSHSKRTNQ